MRDSRRVTVRILIQVFSSMLTRPRWYNPFLGRRPRRLNQLEDRSECAKHDAVVEMLTRHMNIGGSKNMKSKLHFMNENRFNDNIYECICLVFARGDS